MIVRPLEDGSLVLITQTDHAGLSGLFAAGWDARAFGGFARRESLLRAASCHDMSWARWETAPTWDAARGLVPDFMHVPVDETLLADNQWAIDWLDTFDPYAALLVSRHRTGLWRARYGALSDPAPAPGHPLPPATEAFIARQHAWQDARLQSLDRRVFDVDYQLLQIFDILSLYLCTRAPVKRRIGPAPLSYKGDGTDGVMLECEPLDTHEVRVSPFPFMGDRLEVGVVQRHLPTREYADEAAFRAAYRSAVPRVESFTFLRAG